MLLAYLSAGLSPEPCGRENGVGEIELLRLLRWRNLAAVLPLLAQVHHISDNMLYLSHIAVYVQS